ncbi:MULTISPECIES: ABC transporter ATP-binding protein [unclassified Microbacterium]|uniref:ABC transporter ATP-binding protein n=1 Tax=unclassified Microbacterium TaxID=2609290 RepID=UPI000CFB99F9|nr:MULTISPECIES: ABC transporter ATP-binding protein [unclassified Microbacterium]PQZ58115.1 Fe3+/spermidine/putrescine ABC transporter ATP-binding protein [Microbacterium sp. MYb43]PQZ80670.1 Fe3+/spermidine/putrescine ABC transporter ATP-binding protein [Microbacterium sp. MYb40]PRB20402.1 Fe3+/spermidine/putrescine ABC transporter ATP-binding protein [Microbacterium sp. MYb54]PRB32073.1 Fe3+/spermidine/putrescine ABC transporter ATP-binding protein [Microbacterium sp. MYb50]PRB66337.1 Fe3+/
MNERSGGGRLVVDGLKKDYELDGAAVPVVKDVTFTIEPGTFYSLLGPSGCGKTTTLRCVAGLERSNGGVISLDGGVLSTGTEHVSPDKRDIGMVFQNYAIWPHMTVFANAIFPLQVAGSKLPKQEARKRAMEALELVQLDHLAQRPATALSGGQQQRLALARALAHRPRLLLLDEPLSNLDAKLRDTMRNELRSLQRTLGISALYVTHDQSEALSMSDRVAVMNEGRIVQEATPRELYDQPADRFVANFVGRANMIPAVVIDRDGAGDAVVEALGTRLQTPVPDDVSAGDQVTLTFRPETVRWHETAVDRPNVLPVRIVRVEFLGEIVEYEAEVLTDGEPVATIVGRGAPQATPPEGGRVFLELVPHACRVLGA